MNATGEVMRAQYDAGRDYELKRVLAILRKHEASDNAFVRQAVEQIVDEVKGGVQ